ncbi:ATP-dependent Clp protease proteolytic subunit [Parapedobacter defluvii]|uniref:ATP-dependent Clp protease proteolytic subunit n=1 Tax=Parapedobacter defluvii TaxID=2045106 RepID=A0ABQ1M572_9SPHI|nr:ATP-dependent Clp protease proteolytic subunit [Parapedobacter defluvii]RQP13741.1 MAG: ATP-dependent Clp protease proteolytic subunit [Parapedobacter sp.]GGC34573.1 ATP-dependent Clp protease proteolytic subunit [Parapedobacter defluvii]
MNINSNEFRRYAVKHHGINGMYVDQYISGLPAYALPKAMTPYITEERQLNVAQMDVFSRLMVDRIIFLGEPVDDRVANIIQAQLLFLQSADPKKDIQLYVNSPGGSVYAGLGIYDTMQYIGPDVATICTGIALSMAAVLLCAGAKGKRAALPHARVMIHQTSGGMQGTAADMDISIRQTLKIQQELYRIIAAHSGQDFERVDKLSDRDHWMTAGEAKEFGMVDEVLKRGEP